MTERRDLVTTEEAARLLGVTVRHVGRMADDGRLDRIARGILTRESVERYLASHPGQRRRVWREETAWAAIALLAGRDWRDVRWLGAAQVSRLRHVLVGIADPLELVDRTRDRAVIRTFSAHTSVIGRLGQEVAETDQADLGLVEASTDRIDGYLATDRLEEVTRRYALRETSDGNVTLRLTGFDFAIVQELVHTTALTALDLAASLDPRARGVGTNALADVLEDYRIRASQPDFLI